jgi:ATP-binding cassette subfamily B protein RaxB
MNVINTAIFKEEVVRQSQAGECGLACLAMVAEHYDLRIGLTRLRQLFPISARGASLRTLISIADELGFHTRGLKLDVDTLIHLQCPAILHWDLNHYVVLAKVKKLRRGNAYEILDPAEGRRLLDAQELSKHFTGIALELTPSARFSKSDKRERLSIFQLWSRAIGLWPTLAKVLALALIMQVIVLAAPLQMQLSIDYVLSAQDADLAFVLLFAFAGLWLISTLSMFARSFLILNASTTISFQASANLFRQTVFLPIPWFEKRHLGDIVSRFSSLQPISDLVSKGLVAAIVDGLLGVVTLTLMFIYSPVLAGVSIAAIAAYFVIRVTTHAGLRLANIDTITAQAQENSSFLESMRGINAIKLFCREESRQRHWQNYKSRFVNATLKMGRWTAASDVSSSSVVSLESIVFIFVSIKMVMSGSLTLGMVFAFQAFKQSFMGATIRIIDQLLTYRLLNIHLERVSDIAFAEPEEAPSSDTAGKNTGSDVVAFSSLKLANVSFKYGPDAPWILRDLDLEIQSGETIAVVGPSGVGKTTLVKVLCGLVPPTFGAVLVDGQLVTKYGVRRFRQQLGVVSQDDTLFSGSIAENVSFFDLEYDVARVEMCCRSSAILNDILKMPMKLETLIGDMGSTLSGGQKQRLLLARALYKNPNLLVMDEGTAHLDVDTEREISKTIKSLGISRVIVAHRHETIMLADRILLLTDGQLKDVTEATKDRSPMARLPSQHV